LVVFVFDKLWFVLSINFSPFRIKHQKGRHIKSYRKQ
jgi:hypothetical protein